MPVFFIALPKDSTGCCRFGLLWPDNPIVIRDGLPEFLDLFASLRLARRGSLVDLKSARSIGTQSAWFLYLDSDLEMTCIWSAIDILTVGDTDT